MTKISKALAYLQAHPEATTYAAALHAKMAPSPLYAYLKRQKAKEEYRCPTCGQSLLVGPFDSADKLIDALKSDAT